MMRGLALKARLIGRPECIEPHFREPGQANAEKPKTEKPKRLTYSGLLGVGPAQPVDLDNPD